MSIGKFSELEILECRDDDLRVKIAGSVRVRKATSYFPFTKEMFTDFSFPDIPYELDYAHIVPRRLKLREWNGSYSKDVFV